MIISTVVVLLMALVLFALVPRGKGADPATVDVTPVAAHVVAETGWPISAPQDLPDGWKPTNVRFTRVEERRTWHAGYLTADKEYVSIDQTKNATDTWVGANTKDATPSGTMDVDGQTWRKMASPDGQGYALLLPAGQGRPLTTVVWGTSSYDDLATFATRLTPVRAGAGS
jgi:hypothetical protein